MSEGAGPNIYTERWQREMEHGNYGLRGSRIGAEAGASEVGITVYEVEAGRKNLPYHAHLGVEEILVVITGTPTLRSPEGERELAEGEVVAFPRGRGGAHQVINRSGETVRFLMLSSKAPADVIEYPDSSRISAQAGEWGTTDAVAHMLSTENQLEYFEGEPD